MSLFGYEAFPELPQASVERALAELHRRLGSRVLLDEETRHAYRSDDSRIEGVLPHAVVLCESEGDIAEALSIAEETGIPVTPRAGGSGRTGGAVPVRGGIVLATHALDRILDLDPKEGSVLVEPGVRLADLQAAVEAEGWFYPPDPNSAELCCLGGNVAENAAGPRAFKYGATRDYVLGIEAFLMGGTHVSTGRRTRKGVSGYDVTSLLVGSEGTLAAFGRLRLKLIPKPETIVTLVALFPSMLGASSAVSGIIEKRLLPRCLEFLDPKTIEVMRAHGNPIRGDANALLLIEVDGSEETCLRQAELIGNTCDELGALEVSVATTASARKKLAESRKSMSLAVRSRARQKISEDVVVPRTRLGELLEAVVRIGDEHHIDALSYGHAGDGNLHVNFLWNDEEEEPRVEAAIVDLFRRTLELGGTLSGEHGIGILKAPYLGLEQSPALLELQRGIKATFDPKNLMNPGKIFAPSTHRAC